MMKCLAALANSRPSHDFDAGATATLPRASRLAILVFLDFSEPLRQHLDHFVVRSKFLQSPVAEVANVKTRDLGHKTGRLRSVCFQALS